MSGNDQLQYLAWALYVLIFVLVAVRTVRRATRAHLDMTLFFGASTLVIVLSVAPAALKLPTPVWLNALVGSLLMALPYLLLRLVADFADVPAWLLRASCT